MHIVIDARLYGGIGKGIGRYIEQLLKNLGTLDDQHSCSYSRELENSFHDRTYTVLLCPENYHDFVLPSSRWKKVRVDVRWYTLREQWVIPRLLRSLRPDLVHIPHFNVPLFWRGPFVVTIHDLILLRHPSTRASTLSPAWYWIKHILYRFVIRHAVRRAKAVITVSQTVRDQIIKTFKIPSEKIVVTYEGIDHVFRNSKKQETRDKQIQKFQNKKDHSDDSVVFPAEPDQASAWRRFGSRSHYFLYVGNAYPHKNLEFLINWFLEWKEGMTQFPAVAAREFPNYHLVIAGADDYFSRRLITRSSFLVLRRQLLFSGFVSESDLASLYEHATCTIFPSLEEGFGIPPLESLAHGTPTLVSDIPVFHEILGEHAYFFNPKDAVSLTQTVNALLKDPEKAKEKVRAAQAFLTRYRWHIMTQQTLEIYHRHLNPE